MIYFLLQKTEKSLFVHMKLSLFILHVFVIENFIMHFCGT